MSKQDAIMHEPLVTFVTTDYAGITRGRAMAASAYAPGDGKSVGWVPANMSLTPFDAIASPNPWGSTGDLRLLPDDHARYRSRPAGALTDLDMVMSDIVNLDGTPWMCCPRAFLKSALADLERAAGVTLLAAFEHEFQILGAEWQSAPAFSLQALRQADPLGPALMAALQTAGVEPEIFIAEYGKDQFEIAIRPAAGLVAADRAVALREIVRELARHQHWRASFAPVTAVASVGNGVHMHFSLIDQNGGNTTYDPQQPGSVSALAGAFVAGIIRHMPALIAFTAPSPISYLRLQPHRWSSSYTWFGDRDREASLRICPTHQLGGNNPAKSFNIEYRPADATACPHLALGVMVRAGLAGVRAHLPAPALFSGDPETLSDEQRAALGLHRLPGSLEEALATMLADPVVTGWFDPMAIETYAGMKRREMTLAGSALDDALCQRYREIY